MDETLHWSDWTARIEQLNRELESCVADECWDRIAGIQSEKDRALESLDRCLPAEGTGGMESWEAMSRLASQEETLGALFSRVKDSIGRELGQISASSRLSKRFRASYGAKDPADPHWEHFT